MLKARYCPYRLSFKAPAITSRDTMYFKDTYLVQIWDEECPEVKGTGEIALFRGLSAEDGDGFQQEIERALADVDNFNFYYIKSSSINFGIETALRNLRQGGRTVIFPWDFTDGQSKLPINGLIWMGSLRDMNRRVTEKVEQGFRCIKIKIGGLNFYDEIELLRWMRAKYSDKELTIRLDANGSLGRCDYDRAMWVLEKLASFDIHSIEQPFPPSQIENTRKACAAGIIPIALDEQLIGVKSDAEKVEILNTIKPQYIILKPSLCGGFGHADNWIELARERGIGWWATSALESAVGLNAIAQWTASYDVSMPQGLGTGELYRNDFPSPIKRRGEWLSFDYNAPAADYDNLPWINVV